MRVADSGLIDALGAASGIVCAIGAGGKKSLLYRLAQAHPGRVGLTATVQMAPFPDRIEAVLVVSAQPDLRDQVIRAATEARRVAFAHPSPKPHRLSGLAPALVDELHRRAGFDVTYVKADGARMRLMKAPRPDEPVLPGATTTVIPIVSAKALGRPLDPNIAHRLERITAVTGLQSGEPVAPRHIGRLLASPLGALQGVGAARVVPLINMVDTPAIATAAGDAARRALAATDRFDRVVLASLTAPAPIVEIITR